MTRDNTERRSIRARLGSPGPSDLADCLLFKKGVDSFCLVLPLMYLGSARGAENSRPEEILFQQAEEAAVVIRPHGDIPHPSQ